MFLLKSKQSARDGTVTVHSYLYLFELQNLRRFLDSQTTKIEGLKDAEGLEKLKATIAAGKPDWNLLYPYWRGSNNPKDVCFEFDVPAGFAIGASLDRLIDTFDTSEPAMQRLVFWFDN